MYEPYGAVLVRHARLQALQRDGLAPEVVAIGTRSGTLSALRGASAGGRMGQSGLRVMIVSERAPGGARGERRTTLSLVPRWGAAKRAAARTGAARAAAPPPPAGAR